MGEQTTAQHLIRLDVLRFPLIVLIVYLHACGFTINLADGSHALANADTVTAVQTVTGTIGRVAVPLFFLMSGFLFFRGIVFSVDSYRAKLISRARSLLVPFLFWNLALFGLILVAQSVPLLASFFNGGTAPLRTLSLLQVADSIMGITHYPIAYQFWFIRDLMVLVICAPLVWLAARYAAWPVLAVLSLAWLAVLWPVSVPECEPVLFFYLGSLVAIRGWSLFAVDRLSWWLAVPFAIGLAALAAFGGLGDAYYLIRPTAAIGLVLALKASRWLAESDRLREPLVLLGSTSFFVFATHEPMVTIGKKVAFRFLPMTAGTVLTVYALLPILVICVSLSAYWVLRTAAPGFLRLITGGR